MLCDWLTSSIKAASPFLDGIVSVAMMCVNTQKEKKNNWPHVSHKNECSIIKLSEHAYFVILYYNF